MAGSVAVPDEYRGEEVKVDVELEDGETPATVTPEAVVDRCKAVLSTFKSPRFVAHVDDFPFTATPDARFGLSEIRYGMGGLGGATRLATIFP